MTATTNGLHSNTAQILLSINSIMLCQQPQ